MMLKCAAGSKARLLRAAAGSSRSISSLTAPNPSSKTVSFSYAQSLGNIPETKVTRLPNGFTIATESNPNNQSATVGVWINSGSRYESAKTNGTAHFFEHLAFKGTKSRTQIDLERQIESIGGNLGAYTSREQSAFFAKALSSDVSTAVDVLSDVIQRSTFTEDAINQERSVILQEIEDIEKNNKDQVVFDHLHGSAFQGNALGRPIAGHKENIESITHGDIANYLESNFTPDRMVLSAAGGVDHDALVKLAEKHFGSLAPAASAPKVLKPTFVGSELRARYDDQPAAHLILAVEGVSYTNPDYWPLLVAQSLIGSWDQSLGASKHLSSKLAQVIAKNHLANSFSAFNTTYSDTGFFGVYAVTENKTDLDDLTNSIQQEWHRLAMGVTDAEVFRAKNQLKTATLLALQGTNAIADDIGRQVLTFGKRITPWELDGLIEAVTPADIMRVAAKYVYDKEVVAIGYGPVEAMQDFTRIRAAMSPVYW
ncbi:Metalloenzyme, LuxS/M16 peptidase-like protein [Zopfochytrium polystomum]|nr:Metalloenzyme, LuxS/M16 peptidase-like protein [Zopfochytrium polystomum]